MWMLWHFTAFGPQSITGFDIAEDKLNFHIARMQ